jgi:hypothetical protein
MSVQQYGMFAILLPVCVSPALIVLLIGDHRARKVGAFSLAASSYSQRVAKGAEVVPQRTLMEKFKYYWSRMNIFGFLLMGFGFACLLAPLTLNTTATNGYKNRE